jgi:hypothetical protein
LEQRFAPARVGAQLARHLGVAAAAPPDVPLRLRLVTLDAASARQAEPVVSLARELGVEVTSETLSAAAGVSAQVERLRLARTPARFADRARQALDDGHPDLVAVDSFVGAALAGRLERPAVVSLADKGRLWQEIGTAILRQREGAGSA